MTIFKGEPAPLWMRNALGLVEVTDEHVPSADQPIPFALTHLGEHEARRAHLRLVHGVQETEADREAAEEWAEICRAVDGLDADTTPEPSCEVCLDSGVVLQVAGAEPEYEPCPFCALPEVPC